MVSGNSGDVRLEGTEGQNDAVGGLGGALKDGYRVTALPTCSSPDRTPQALMLTPLSHSPEGSLPLTVGILAEPMIMWPEMGLCPQDSLVLES